MKGTQGIGSSNDYSGTTNNGIIENSTIIR